MKTLKIWIITGLLILPLVPTELYAESKKSSYRRASIEAAESARAEVLLLRLDEIKAMDKSHLTSSEKKLLRKEVRSTKRELDDLGGGVYISIGAIIIIALLLIIFL